MMSDYYGKNKKKPPSPLPFSVARVNLIDAPYSLDKTYDYYIPEPLTDSIKAGGFAVVPFGGGNRRQIALITEISDHTDYPEFKLKTIYGPVENSVYLTPEQLSLCVYLKETTFCSMGEAVRTIMPSAALSSVSEYYEIAETPPMDSDLTTLSVYSLLSKVGPVTRERIQTECGDDAYRKLPQMIKKGYITRQTEIAGSASVRYQTFYSLAKDTDSIKEDLKTIKRRGAVRQAAVLEALLECPESAMTSVELRSMTGAAASVLKNLTESGLLKEEKKDLYRDPYAGQMPEPQPDDNVLSPEQQQAADKLIEIYRTNEPKAALLHGVTGSGKTRVIKRLIDEVIASPTDENGIGRAVIVLVPEISLTPQAVGFFRSYYKDRVVVLHSGLSAGERYDSWRRMSAGEVDVCIGTRSAVFAPFPRIGMIVIDEEQEHTYKSDMTPRYHAREIARYRCAKHNALMLLSSATPSLEAYRKAETGAYTLVELRTRYGGAILPEVIIADSRVDLKNGIIGPVGSVLREEIEKNLQNGEQSILFLNRRGYNRFLRCPLCGEVIMCPHCSVALTFHSARQGEGHLSCHWCGYRTNVPDKCPGCGGEHLSYEGYGTQKVEEELKKLFPAARILRLDADTTTAKFSCDEILNAFKNREADILLGTQMVTKGHDFPDVTLVGVLSADMSLYLNDYRANEETFALLTQVIGRAGRSDKPGRAVIQTYSPDHPVIHLAAKQDYLNFYKNEAALRKALVFPPFCDIAQLTLTGEGETHLYNAAVALNDYIKSQLIGSYKDVSVVVTGPFEPYQYKINDKYQLRFMIKCGMNRRTRKFLNSIISMMNEQAYKLVTASLDINPN